MSPSKEPRHYYVLCFRPTIWIMDQVAIGVMVGSPSEGWRIRIVQDLSRAKLIDDKSLIDSSADIFESMKNPIDVEIRPNKHNNVKVNGHCASWLRWTEMLPIADDRDIDDLAEWMLMVCTWGSK